MSKWMQHGTRWAIALGAGALAVVLVAAPAAACGGLVGANGTIKLTRTTTLAAYHDGVERYVTSFEFDGQGKEVGSIVPLPGVPSTVERGGDWTLQRLEREVAPPRARRCRVLGQGVCRQRGGHPPDQDRRARHHDPEGRRKCGRQVGDGARIPADARRAGDVGLLREPEPDLHGRPVSTRHAPANSARARATERRSC